MQASLPGLTLTRTPDSCPGSDPCSALDSGMVGPRALLATHWSQIRSHAQAPRPKPQPRSPAPPQLRPRRRSNVAFSVWGPAWVPDACSSPNSIFRTRLQPGAGVGSDFGPQGHERGKWGPAARDQGWITWGCALCRAVPRPGSCPPEQGSSSLRTAASPPLVLASLLTMRLRPDLVMGARSLPGQGRKGRLPDPPGNLNQA